MKILLLGKDGMLGKEFLEVLAGEEGFDLYALDKNEVDIGDSDAVHDLFQRISPDFVINCAAYTAVDDCESNQDEAFLINGDAVGVLADLCHKEKAILLHFSTDYVFDGKKSSGYDEHDVPSPINIYGESKLRGETLIQKKMDQFYIVRISWLFGLHGQSFIDQMYEFAKDRDELRVVTDQTASPTYATDLVEGILSCYVSAHFKNKDKVHAFNFVRENDVCAGSHEKLPFGVYHLTNSGHTNRYGLVKELTSLVDSDVKLLEAKAADFPTPAQRPVYSILNNNKTPLLRSWEEALKAYFSLRYNRRLG